MTNLNKRLELKNNLPFFENLSTKEKEELFSSSYIEKYKKGELVHSKDKSCTGIVLVLEGQLRSFMSSLSGKEITLFRLFELDMCMLSSSCVYQNLTYDISVQADKDSTVIIIDSAFFKEISSKNPTIQNFFLELTQNKLSEVMWVVEQVVFFNLEYRLANYLLDKYYLDSSVNINITHEVIANDLGSAREVISRMLKRFEKENVVEIGRGQIKIIDLEQLKLLTK